MTRRAFYISDHTGLTAEIQARSLLSQFPGSVQHGETLPFVDSEEKARQAVERIRQAAEQDGARPLVFSTLIVPALRDIVSRCDALFLDLFALYTERLEVELGSPSRHEIGRSHAAGASYPARIDAVNYALNHDDGGISHDLARADIVLVGVSRCGKTPTSLYLALQFGVYAANYPLVEEDFTASRLPPALEPLRGRLQGLTISAERLHEIRAERAPDSRYASIENCREELRSAARLMARAGIPSLDVTRMSVEEIATTLMQQRNLSRRT